MSGEQQQDTETDCILHAQTLTIDLGCQQLAHHVVSRRMFALLQHLLEVVGHLIKGACEALDLWIISLLLFRFEELCIIQLLPEQSISPAFEQWSITARYSQHFGDDYCWQWIRYICGKIHFARW